MCVSAIALPAGNAAVQKLNDGIGYLGMPRKDHSTRFYVLIMGSVHHQRGCGRENNRVHHHFHVKTEEAVQKYNAADRNAKLADAHVREFFGAVHADDVSSAAGAAGAQGQTDAGTR